MTYTKKQSTIIEFAENVPKTITLKTEPSMAKPKEYVSKAGKPYTKWTYFTTNGEVFWPLSYLHQELMKFRAGDTVTITNVVPVGSKYGTYKVEGADGTGIPATTDLQMLARENNNLIRALIQKLDSFMGVKEGAKPQATPVGPGQNNVEEPKREKSNTDLGF